MSKRREDYRGGDAPQGPPDKVPPGSYFGSYPGTINEEKIQSSGFDSIIIECSDDFDGITEFNAEGFRVKSGLLGK